MSIRIVGTPFARGGDSASAAQGALLTIPGTIDPAANLGVLFGYAATERAVSSFIPPGPATQILSAMFIGRKADTSYRANPSTGPQTARMQLSAHTGTNRRVMYGVVLGIADADVSGNPIRTAAPIMTGTGGVPEITVTGQPGDLALACMYAEESRAAALVLGQPFHDGGHTISGFTADNNAAACALVGGWALIGPTGSALFRFSLEAGSGRDWQIHGFSVKAAAAAPVPGDGIPPAVLNELLTQTDAERER